MPITLYEAKSHYYSRQNPSIKVFLEEIQKFNWFTKKQAWWYFREVEGRDNGRIERLLRRLSKEKRIQMATPFDGFPAFYSANRINRKSYDHTLSRIYHGLGITEGYIRLWKADPKPKVYKKEKEYTGQRPEFTITYSTGSTLYYEFSTGDNIKALKTKIRNYELILPEKSLVLFVLDINRENIPSLIDRYKPQGSFYFTDYESFKRVSIGQQLTEQIYFTPNGEIGGLRCST